MVPVTFLNAGRDGLTTVVCGDQELIKVVCDDQECRLIIITLPSWISIYVSGTNPWNYYI